MEFEFNETSETMSFISNIPFVKKLIQQNNKLQKKNKELKQLVKLITNNFHLFQHNEKPEFIKTPIKLEKNELDVSKLDDEVIIVEPPQNIQYEIHTIGSDDTDIVNPSSDCNPITPKKNNSIDLVIKTEIDLNQRTNLNSDFGKSTDQFVSCDDCSLVVDCHKNSIHIFYKGTSEKLQDDKTLCNMCFQDKAEELINSGFTCDDLSIEEEEEEEVEEEEVEEEEEEVEEEEVEEEEEEEEVEEEEVEEEEVEEEEVEEEEEEEEVEVEEEEVEVEEEEEVEVEEEEEEEEEEEDVYEIIINKKTYYTNDMKNGILYADDNGDVGEEVGKIEDGVHKFNKTK